MSGVFYSEIVEWYNTALLTRISLVRIQLSEQCKMAFEAIALLRDVESSRRFAELAWYNDPI